MTNELKIDLDSHGFLGWLSRFRKGYGQLMVEGGNRKYGLQPQASVMRTRHGYHIYLYTKRTVSGVEANLLECIFGSDIRKQTIQLGDGNDILFVEKDGYREMYDGKRSVMLRDSISAINKRDGYSVIERIRVV